LFLDLIPVTTLTWQFDISEDRHNDRFEDDVERNEYTFFKRSLYLELFDKLNDLQSRSFLEVIGPTGNLIVKNYDLFVIPF